VGKILSTRGSKMAKQQGFIYLTTNRSTPEQSAKTIKFLEKEFGIELG
jgi:hypothetical protein